MVNRYLVEFRAYNRRYGKNRTDSLSVISTTPYGAKERVKRDIKNAVGCDIVVYGVFDEIGNLLWKPDFGIQTPVK